MPTSHAAVRHGVNWGKARRAEKAFSPSGIAPAKSGSPATSASMRFQRGKGQRFWTVLSDVVHGEVIGLRQDRSEATAMTLLTEDLTAANAARIRSDRPETLHGF